METPISSEIISFGRLTNSTDLLAEEGILTIFGQIFVDEYMLRILEETARLCSLRGKGRRSLVFIDSDFSVSNKKDFKYYDLIHFLFV